MQFNFAHPFSVTDGPASLTLDSIIDVLIVTSTLQEAIRSARTHGGSPASRGSRARHQPPPPAPPLAADPHLVLFAVPA